MIRLALNNSIMETKSSSSVLDSIEEMKTFWPTESEFKEPVVYIENLLRTQNIMQYGCIKIIPPESFNPPLAFDMASD